MAGSFRIAEGFVEVTADESNYDRAIQRLKSKKTTATVTLDIDDSAALAKLRRFADEHSRTVLKAVIDADLSEASVRRVSAALDRLTKDRVVNIRASVDTRVGAAEIRNLTQRRQVRIGIDVDTRVAADSIANLTRRRQMTIQANADTADARARLDALTRDRRMNVRVDVDRSALSLMSSIGGGGGGGGISFLSSSLARLAAVAVGALPTLASLGQSLVAMGPAAAVAAPAVLSLGAAFTAIKVGTSGIGDAFKAAFAPAVKSASAAESATRRVESAQRSLAKAQQAVEDAEVAAAEARVKAARDVQDAQQSLKNTVQDVADANRRAAESVASAERDLADAQRAARKAQQDLTQARKEAAQELEDLNNRLTDAQLDQRQKVLDLQDAEQNLAAVKAKGAAATQEELDKAQLQYDRAVQALQEQKTETARLQEQADAANKAGVEGSDQVTKAKQGIADANQQVADKTKALKDAETEAARTQEDGAQRVARAQRDVADAQATAAKAAKDGARQIADAQQAAADAAQALAQAQQSVGLATNKLADAMARLAPNARAFVNAVIAQGAAWRGLKLDVQNALFQGLGQTFTTMSTAILPALRAGLTGTAEILNQTAKNAAGAVTELGKSGQLRQMFDGLNQGMQPLTRIPGQIITGLTQISIAASPAFKRLTTAAATAADGIAKKLGDAFKSGALEDAINNGVEIAKQFGTLLGDAFGTLNNIMKAAAAGGGDALGALGSVFAELRRITAMPEVQQALTQIFKAVNAIAKLIASGLGAAIEAALPLLAAIAPVVTELAEKFGPVLNELLGTLGKALTPIIDALLPVVTDIGDVIVGLVQAVMPLLQPIGDLLGAIITAVAPLVKMIGDELVTLIGALAQGLAPVVQALVPVVQLFGQFLGALAPLFPPILQALMPLIPPISQLAVALLNLALQVITPLMPLIVGLAELLTGVLAGAIGILVPAISTVIGWITTFVDAITSGVQWVADKFQWLYDVLVGHSIIPDLVNAIVGWFTNLWKNTVQIFNQIKSWVVDTWNKLWKAASDRWSSFWSGLWKSLLGAKTSVMNWLNGLRSWFSNAWSGMWNSAASKLTGILNSLRKGLGEFKTWMLNAVRALRDGSGNLWSGIQGKMSTPIKWVVQHVYNDGVRKMWNTIAGKISSKITLPYIKLGFSQGGVVPGKPSNKDTVPAMLAPGERVLSNPEVAKLGGHTAIDTLLGQTPRNPTRQDAQKPVPGFANGGIIGTITGALGSAADWAKGLVVGGLESAARKAINAVIKPLINKIPGGGLGGLLKGLSNKALAGILGWFGGQDKKAGQVDYTPGAGVAQWKPQILQALQILGQSSGWLGTVQRRMNQESGGNPRAVNRWDINWQLGHPSVGLMQVIGPTFAAYAGRFRGTGPFMYGTSINPVANIYSGLNYAIHRYGSLSALNRPGGYDSGGLLQPGATMAVNNTGRPERVLNADQTARLDALLNQAAVAGGGVTVNMTVHSLAMPTPAERKAWAAGMARDINEALRAWNRGRI